MKKVLFILFLFGLACFMAVVRVYFWQEIPEVAYLNLSYNAGPVSPEYYFEGNLHFVPEYESRSLGVIYELKYPYRNEETEKEDFFANGLIGGEFFDRFEDMIGFVLDESKVDEYDACMGGKNISAEVGLPDGTSHYQSVYICGEEPYDMVIELEIFYNDVARLLEEDVY